MVEEWVASFTKWLGAEKHDISIEERWNDTRPTNVDKGFFETFRKVCSEPTLFQVLRRFAS
jgi:hypothetical protein